MNCSIEFEQIWWVLICIKQWGRVELSDPKVSYLLSLILKRWFRQNTARALTTVFFVHLSFYELAWVIMQGQCVCVCVWTAWGIMKTTQWLCNVVTLLEKSGQFKMCFFALPEKCSNPTACHKAAFYYLRCRLRLAALLKWMMTPGYVERVKMKTPHPPTAAFLCFSILFHVQLLHLWSGRNTTVETDGSWAFHTGNKTREELGSGWPIRIPRLILAYRQIRSRAEAGP